MVCLISETDLIAKLQTLLKIKKILSKVLISQNLFCFGHLLPIFLAVVVEIYQKMSEFHLPQ